MDTQQLINDFYLKPYIQKFDSLRGLLNPDPKMHLYSHQVNQNLDFEELNQLKLGLIVGEPGCGKSQMMQKLKEHKGQDAIIIDCKILANSTLSAIANLDHATHIYFDGLDEVAPRDFGLILQSIADFSEQHSHCHCFVSCRIHYLERYFEFVSKLKDAFYILVRPFEDHQIRAYLDEFISDHDLISKILQNSKAVNSQKSVLTIPRYLSAFVLFIMQSKKTASEIEKMKRTEIFEEVIYYKLHNDIKTQRPVSMLSENSNPNSETQVASLIEQVINRLSEKKVQYNEKFITKRVLEKLAFIMEVYQRNRISHEELVTFLDETKSNINLIFLNHSSLDTFIERTLKTVDFGFIEFENTEFQEYLAAKEMARLANSEQALYDLILQPDLNLIYLSWYDVLQYAIELNTSPVISALKNYLNLYSARPLDIRLIDLLTSSEVAQAETGLQTQLFQVLFNYYQSSGTYIYQKYDTIAQLYQPANNELIILKELQSKNQKELIQFINRALLVGSVSKVANLDFQLTEIWKSYLIKLLKDKGFSGYAETLFWVLNALCAEKELVEMYQEIQSRPSEFVEIYAKSLANTCANQGGDILIDLLQNYPLTAGKDILLEHITDPVVLHKVLDAIATDEAMIVSLFADDNSHTLFYTLFDRIKEINDVQLDKKIEDLFFKCCAAPRLYSRSGASKYFLERTLGYLLEKDEQFLSKFMRVPDFDEVQHNFAEEISKRLTKDQFKRILDEFQTGSFYFYGVRNIVHYLTHSANPDRINLTEDLKAAHPDHFNQDEKSKEARRKQLEHQKLQIKQQFTSLTCPGQPIFDKELLKFYYSNRETLDEIITLDQKEYLKKIVTDHINLIDPDQYIIKLTVSAGGKAFDINSDIWFNFALYFRLAQHLGLTSILEKNRHKILKYVPLMNQYLVNEHSIVEEIMDFLGTITEKEINDLLDFCISRKDDYLFSSARSFANLIGQFKLKSFKPVLKLIIHSPSCDVSDKQEALYTFGKMAEPEDQSFLQDIFNQNLNIFPTLAEAANEALIIQFEDRNAIDWRISQMKQMQIDLNGQASQGEHEFFMGRYLEQRTLGSCFCDFDLPKFDAEIEDLFRFALSNRKTGITDKNSDYLYLIISSYFKRYISLPGLSLLRRIIEEPVNQLVGSTFQLYLLELEYEYVGNYQQFKNISEAIKQYNQIKAKSYLPVYNDADLQLIVSQSFDGLKDFVTYEGYGRNAQQLSGKKIGKSKLFNEDILQKTFKLFLEKHLLSRGIRQTDIYREVQLYDDKRLDILIKYGFIGPIMAELKLLSNDEITDDAKRTAYKPKLIQYMKATNSKYGFYLIFKTADDPNGKHMASYTKLVSEYADIPGLEFKLIDCT
ncbi:hypothetical protein [Pedobacter gandavensis]|uniref:NACHT domain-containing protein n=1 Tax=Pedobacter gandavensis TaxID=2679963 RepID=UPI00292D301C|nr:hypothetical protein [Pedobacter gandavensis]